MLLYFLSINFSTKLQNNFPILFTTNSLQRVRPTIYMLVSPTFNKYESSKIYEFSYGAKYYKLLSLPWTP
jgi:hypothetical protein